MTQNNTNTNTDEYHVADTKELQILSLFAGVGMLDEGVHSALRARDRGSRTICSCEWESGAAATLLSRMEEQSVEPHPIWCGDLYDLPVDELPRVDVIVAGYPCQPYSAAGKQRGLEDERSMGGDRGGPVGAMLDLIGALRPALVLLENVGLAVGHLRPIGQRLEADGYIVAPPLLLAAEDVGASHKRERMFVLAYRSGAGREERPHDPDHTVGREKSDEPTGLSGSPLAHPQRERGRGRDDEWENAADVDPRGEGAVGDRRPLFAPGPDSPDWGHIPRHLRPAVPAGEAVGHPEGDRRAQGRDGEIQLPERGQDEAFPEPGGAGRGEELGHPPRELPHGSGSGVEGRGGRQPSDPGDDRHKAPPEPVVRGLADGDAAALAPPVAVDLGRADALRCGGNSVVAAQAGLACLHLLDELEGFLGHRVI